MWWWGKMAKRLTLLLVLLILAPAAGAQETPWSVWLLNAQDHAKQEIARVYLDGEVETFSLETPEGGYVSLMGFNHAGDMMALCLTDGDGESRIAVREIYAGIDRASYTLGAPVSCGTAAFNPEDNLLAFSLMLFGGPEGDGGASWEVRVLDLSTGQIAGSVGADASGAAELLPQALQDEGFVPQIRVFEAGRVIFAAMPWGVVSPPDYPVLRWKVGADALEAGASMYSYVHMDRLPATGEVVGLALDEKLPMGVPPPGLIQPFNTVTYADVTGESRVILHRPQVLRQVVFIDEGRQIALHGLSDYVDGATPIKDRWTAMDREGAVWDLPPEVSGYDLAGAPEGYVFLRAEYPDPDSTAAQTSLHYHRVSGAGLLEAAALWEDNRAGWQIKWAAPMPEVGGLVPFPAADGE